MISTIYVRERRELSLFLSLFPVLLACLSISLVLKACLARIALVSINTELLFFSSLHIFRLLVVIAAVDVAATVTCRSVDYFLCFLLPLFLSVHPLLP